MAIETAVLPGAAKVVGLENKPATSLKSSLSSAVKDSGKRLKRTFLGFAPENSQYLAEGTVLSAVLQSPLDFGVALFEAGSLDKIGSELPDDDVLSVRLTTPLDSRKTKLGDVVEAVLSQPVYSAGQLIFPAGSILRGEVTEVKSSRVLHRNGKLTFNFTSLQPPDFLTSSVMPAHRVDGSVVSIQVGHSMKNLRINEDGAARIVESKTRFLAPAWAIVKAEGAIGSNADPFGKAFLGAYRGSVMKQLTGREPRLGITAGIAGAMLPPVGIGLGVYGAATSVYSTFLGRGKDIQLPANTSMEVRIGKPEETQSQP
jgi:hypothetical protein